MHSIDGHPLPIDELKGTKPTEKIDLSHKKFQLLQVMRAYVAPGEAFHVRVPVVSKLGVTSGIIIASCIKENDVLKELKCAAHASVHADINIRTAHHRSHRFSSPLHVPTHTRHTHAPRHRAT